jgi:chlorite dismutase
MAFTQLGDRLVRFTGGDTGMWRVLAIRPVLGDTLPQTERVAVCRGDEPSPLKSQWALSGVISNVRYVERPEQQELTLKQAPLGRSEATLAALIPIRKTAAWWNLTQEERRSIFEKKSHHIAEGVRYLPSVARQLYHSRDIGEPFDFLTWFEYAPEHSEAFEELVRTLRKTEEWQFVDREIDIRLMRDSKG